MNYSKQELWDRFQKYHTDFPALGLSVDLSRMNFADDFLFSMQPRLKVAFEEMAALEKGAIANKDENRMVGHYWLRNPALAPTPEIRQEIEKTIVAIKAFAAQIRTGKIRGAAGRFKNLLVIGIGGSALGPQFVASALGNPAKDKLKVYFFDNTDPDGIDRTLAQIGKKLGQTLSIVISKSGGTKETRNGMMEAKAAYEASGLDFSRHAVAITRDGSDLDKYAIEQKWLERFPMWDWVGGRTSELSAVGLLPAALQGLDIKSILEGAKACDKATRTTRFETNPAAQLALMWYYAGNGNGTKNLITLPYKDRLELFSKYLQQLIMESLGKRLDRDDKLVNQGLTVLGNKGSTDQHSYIQQLRDGLNDFFVTFIEVLRDREGKSADMEGGATTGDYLEGFFLGTRSALYESDRESVTLTVQNVSPKTVGMLIALFERTVGLYASLINVNAYHQPGVEAGKKAASVVLDIQKRVVQFLSANQAKPFSVAEIAQGIGSSDEAETVFKICQHLAANPDRNIGTQPALRSVETKYFWI